MRENSVVSEQPVSVERILFVDDDEIMLKSWERTLRRQFKLDTAASPELALDKIATAGPYAVIVSDMRMPGMSGLEMLRRARDLSPHSIRVLLTGNPNLNVALEASTDDGIFRFLEKPCSNETLSEALTAALKQYRIG